MFDPFTAPPQWTQAALRFEVITTNESFGLYSSKFRNRDLPIRDFQGEPRTSIHLVEPSISNTMGFGCSTLAVADLVKKSNV